MTNITSENIIFDNDNIILVITVMIINNAKNIKYLEDVSIIDNMSNYRYHYSCFFNKCHVIFISTKENFPILNKENLLPAEIYGIPESKLKNMIFFKAKISYLRIKEGTYNKSEIISNILYKFLI
jgi:hypothetical protein